MSKLLSRILIFIGLMGILPLPLKPFVALYGFWLLTGIFWSIAKYLREHYKIWKLMRSEPHLKRSTHVSPTLPPPVFIPSGDSQTDFARALGWPMAAHYPKTQDNGRERHPIALHYFGLRTDLKREPIRRQLPEKLQKQWFTLDLNRLHSSDEPRAAMAFACVRLSFYVESAYRLGWLDNSLYQQLLLLNAARAQECFTDWPHFASAYVQGRTQWLARGRSDIAGIPVCAEQAQNWLSEAGHPWHQLPWPSAGCALTLVKTASQEASGCLNNPV